MAAFGKESAEAARPPLTDELGYPTGMVWCPMKMSGMAILRCARLQRQLGCGTLRDLEILKATRPERFVFFWPWLRARGECPQRPSEKQVKELLLEVTSLKVVQGSRRDPRAYRCPRCHGRKSFSAELCRRCWRLSLRPQSRLAAP